MTNENKELALSPSKQIGKMLESASVIEKFTKSLGNAAAGQLFATSILDLYNSDTNLQKCAPGKVISVALNAAVLKLPINKQLGFAWIVPYDKKKKVDGKWVVVESTPTFQIGWKGYVQLAMRTGLYKYINAGPVYKGELKSYDKLSGALDLSGERDGDEIEGYFAYIQTLNGFSKTMYSTVEDMEKHAKRYSPGYKNDQSKKSAWSTNFDEMATKTLIRLLIGKYGVMSVEMAGAMSNALAMDEQTPEDKLREEIAASDEEIIDIESQDVDDTIHTDEDEDRFTEEENLDKAKTERVTTNGPNF